jgi:DNA repair exonuclease SbcCD nuclease subunit
MTTIWPMSDLHVDVRAFNLPRRPECDVVAIAGDIGERLCEHVIPWIEERFDGSVPVVYVPGNHDFYRCRLPREIETARFCARYLPWLHLLAEGESVVLAGARFVGATLWTDYQLDPLGPVIAGLNARHGMNDHRRIQILRPDGTPRRFDPGDARAAHQRHRAAIEAVLAVPFDGPTVVVTHHAPHPRSLRGGAYSQSLDAAYASDLSPMMDGPTAPALWVHGHVHERRDYVVGDTRIVANPRGYVAEGRRGALEIENPAFDPTLVIEV